jgi:acetylornithine deacetylase/succinyl-diaminopimelate desuccinylase-like protein
VSRFKPVDGELKMKTENFTVMRQTGTQGTDLEASLRVCTKWVNMKLKQAGVDPVEDLIESFKSGIVLATVLEQLEPGLRVKVKKNARYAALWLDNLNICFKAIDKLKIPHKGIVAKDFMDGRTKLIVAFIWRLITTYDLPRSSKLILKWFNKRIKKFGYEIDIMDPCPGVACGVPFNALVESQREGTFDVPSLSGADPAAVCEEAFQFLQQEYEVDSLLEGPDVASGAIDDVSLVLYLKQVKDAFDNECFDVEPESMEYEGCPWIFSPGEAVGPFLPVVLPGPSDEHPNGVENLEFEVEPDLPEGLVMHDETGAISGTPTAEGCCDATDFVVTAMNSSGEVECTINIMVREIEPTGIAFAAESVLFVVGEEGAGETPHVEPVDTRVSFTIEPALHAGLTLNEETGCISGTAAEFATESANNQLETMHTVTASNSGGAVSTQILVAVQHVAPTSLECDDLHLTVGDQVAAQCVLQPEGCIVEWIAQGDTRLVPDPISMNNGMLSGTVTEPGEFNITISASNSGGSVEHTVNFIIVDKAPTSINYNDAVSAVAEVGIQSGGLAPVVDPVTPVTFTIEPELPSGLVFDEATGSVTGVPDATAVGETEHKVTATNTGGMCETSLTVQVLEVPPSGLVYPNNQGDDNNFNITLNVDDVNFAPVFEGKGTFHIEPALPEQLHLAEDGSGTICGLVSDPDLFGTSSTYTVTLSNTGGECAVDVTLSFSDAKREFFEYVDSHQSDYIKELSDCVAIPSVYQDNVCNDADTVLSWCTDKLVNLGGEITDLGDGIRGVTFSGASESCLCVYGNLDVLEGGELVTLQEIDGCLTGTGASKSKGPIVAWMNTIDAYKKLGRDLPLCLKLVVDTTGVAASSALASSDKVKDYLSNVNHICIADGSSISEETPAIIYACRGVEHYTLTANTNSQNTASGAAGSLAEAMGVLAGLMGQLSALEFGHVGEDDDLAVTFSVEEWERHLGIKSPYTKEQCLARMWHTSQLSMHGLTTSAPAYNPANVGTYTIPSSAKLTFSVRTANGVPVEKEINAICGTVGEGEGDLSCDKSVRPFRATTHGTNYQAAMDALAEVSSGAPEFIQTGDTIAAASILEDMTGVAPVIMPISKFDLLPTKNYMDGIKVQGMYLENLASASDCAEEEQ